MKLIKQISLIVFAISFFSNHLLAQGLAFQKGSYKDNFQYLSSPGTCDSNSFNNWFWEIYPQTWLSNPDSTADKWISFQFKIFANDKSYPTATCSQLTVKKSAPLFDGVQPYQDAEMFNNVCVKGQQSPNPTSQPSCGSVFPQGRLSKVEPPYIMSNSTADSNALYNSMIVPLGMVNSPYYPSDKVAYKIKMRIKADGPTYGTRGWGFWNTNFGGNQDYFAWFYEWGINFDYSDTIKSVPLVFPTAITINDDSVSVTVLILNAYQWHDYEIIWSADAMEYFIDGTLVASHSNPPSADIQHAMAFHNWVDNRLYSKGSNIDGTFVSLPMDKSNFIDRFVAEPVFNYKKNNTKPFSLITLSYPVTGNQKKALSKVKNTNPNARHPDLKSIIDKLMQEHDKEIKNLIKEKRTNSVKHD